MYEGRLEKLRRILLSKELDALILRCPENIYYFSGFRGSEGLLLVSMDESILVTDFRYMTYAKEELKGIKVLEKTKEKNPVYAIIEESNFKRVGFEAMHTPFSVYSEWKERIKGVELLPLGNEIEKIRGIKEPGELDLMLRAVSIAEEALIEVLDNLKPGRTEKEIAIEIDLAMMRKGAESPSFETIVASGERSALPHARPSDKVLKSDEVVIIDFGAKYEGYCSDETVTVFLGEPPPLIRRLREIVSEAKNMALLAIRDGVEARTIDSIVRSFIEKEGFGAYFGHGTGHGIGLSVHELPSINETSDGILESQMVVTIEPGIYIPKVGGVRLEDMVLVGEGHSTVLTKLNKELNL